MYNYRRIFACAAVSMFAACVMQTGQALSQQLPWQTSPSPQQQPQQGHHHKSSANTQPSPATSPQGSEREQDDRELNNLATQFYHISSKDKQAVTKLRELEIRVKEYLVILKQRTYNVGDIIKDGEKLQGRIAGQRKKLEAKAAAESKKEAAKAASPPAVTPTPATPVMPPSAPAAGNP